MDEKFEKRYRSFCNSLDALEEAKQRDLSDSFVLSGTSAKFSITYAMTGFIAGSPREVLKTSYKAELISDDAWMEMLKVRNQLAHDYDCEIVKHYCKTIVEQYIDLFYEFKRKVEQLLHAVG